jgi:transforming growth factor-beta-induced protein
VDIASASPDFSTLVTAVQAAGLVETLSGPGPFTVFAPNNAAFAKLPAGTLNGLLQDTNKLRQVLLYHVVSGRVRSTDLRAGKVATLQGAAATVDLSSGVKINDATVIAADVEASNGVIHVIDTVILPPGSIVDIAAGNPDFSTLVTAAQAAGLVNFFNSSRLSTVFAPNNAAFAKLPAGTLNALLQDTNKLRQVLLYHVVSGRVRSTDLRAGKVVTLQGAAAMVDLSSGVKINDATVIAADVEASNGVIHVIDRVILPPPDIVELAARNADFSTLVSAVQAAGLVDLLKADGPFTVFAPNNAAFAKLPAGTLDALLQDTNRLRHILLYHVNHGPRLRAADLKSGQLLTLHGAPARLEVTPAGVKVNQANVITADVEAGNGIIHILDEVILPADGFQGFSVSAIVKEGRATVVWPVIVGQQQTLESTDDLRGGVWRPVAGTPVTADGVSKLELDAGSGVQFFRVRSGP